MRAPCGSGACGPVPVGSPPSRTSALVPGARKAPPRNCADPIPFETDRRHHRARRARKRRTARGGGPHDAARSRRTSPPVPRTQRTRPRGRCDAGPRTRIAPKRDPHRSPASRFRRNGTPAGPRGPEPNDGLHDGDRPPDPESAPHLSMRRRSVRRRATPEQSRATMRTKGPQSRRYRETRRTTTASEDTPIVPSSVPSALSSARPAFGLVVRCRTDLEPEPRVRRPRTLAPTLTRTVSTNIALYLKQQDKSA